MWTGGVLGWSTMCADLLTVAKEQYADEGSQRGGGGVDNLSAITHRRNTVATHRCWRERKEKETMRDRIRQKTYRIIKEEKILPQC